MSAKLQTVMNWIDQFAPKYLAEEWDNVGLQIGDPSMNITKIMLTLDVNLEIVEEAIENKVDLLVSHHPFIFKPLKNIRYDLPSGKIISKLIENKIALYAAHTNLDSVKGGINCVLAQKLGLESIEVLNPSFEEKLCKLVVFVPIDYRDQVRAAMSAAGAGWIGNYSDCTFQLEGKGTFKARKGAEPFIGEVGQLEVVDEVRIETILPNRLINKVIKAVTKAHPYEEVAYDLVPLLNEGSKTGLGRIGYLSEATTFETFIQQVKAVLNVPTVRVGGDLATKVKRIAVCGGAGSSLMGKAAFRGADVIVTGDIKYHEGQDIVASGMNFIDAGHNQTEIIILPILAEYLKEQITKQKAEVSLVFAQSNTDPFCYV